MAKRGRPRHPDILTPREWEVLALLREGRSNEEIAGALGVTLATARFHVSEILTKLGVSSRRDAAAWQPAGDGARRPLGALVPLLRGYMRPAALLATATALVALTVAILLLWWGVLQTGTRSASQTLSPTPEDAGVPAPQLTLVSGSTTSVAWASNDVAWSGGFGGVFRSTDRGRSWSLGYTAPEPVQAVAAAPDGLHGWASGGLGMLLHTEDGGVTWSPQQSGTDVNLDHLIALSTDVAMVAGRTKGFSDVGTPARPVILRTDDGGASWNRVRVAKGVVAADSMSFLEDGRNGWMSTESCPDGKNGILGGCVKERALYQTHDGGKSWERSESGEGLLGLQFVDQQHGWAILSNCGDGGCPSALVRTADGGKTWDRVTVSGEEIAGANAPLFNAFHAFTADTVIASDGACHDACSHLWRTTDAGVTWQDLGDAGAPTAGNYAFANPDNGIAASPLSWTDDGGTTWHAAAAPLAIGFGVVDATDDQRAWFAGTQLLRTDDGGAHWSVVSDRMFTSLSFVSPAEGWGTALMNDAGTSRVAVLHTNDGGANWEQQYATADDSAASARVVFVSPLDGWLAMPAGHRAAHTRDGGMTWVEQDLPTRAGAGNVGPATFPATDTAWAATDAVLFATHDGGAHWGQVRDFARDSCNRVQDIAAYGAQVVRAVVACHSGLALFGSDDAGATWWSAVAPPLYNLTLFDPLHGAALTPQWCAPTAADSCKRAVIRTDDGGHTWSLVDLKLPQTATLKPLFTPPRTWIVADTTIDSFSAAATSERLYRYDLP